MAQRSGATPQGDRRGNRRAETSFAAGGYRARTEDTAARLRQALGEFLAVAQDYAARRGQEARAALTMAAREMAMGAALLAAAAAFGGLALCLALAAGVIGLSIALPPWAAALIACGVLLVVAAILFLMGMRRLRTRRLAVLVQTLRADRDRVRDALFAHEENGTRPRPARSAPPDRM
jgi:hypothetical protein